MKIGAAPTANMGAAQTFVLPEGWTHRRVAVALAREWLEPFRPEVVSKSTRWIVQPIVEKPANGLPLWEDGISTEEYERRLERTDLIWSVRAKSGRSNGLILARLTRDESRPMTFDMVCSQDSVPETLIDPSRMAAFLEDHHLQGVEGLFTGLLLDHGFQAVSHPKDV